MDLPVITEATNEFYRNVYADAELGPIFKGKNMLVLRNHTSYMINELAQCDLPMPSRRIEQLSKIHSQVIAKYKTTKRHFERMQSFLMEALEASGAEPEHVSKLKEKLLPLSDVFPVGASSDASTGSADRLVTLQKQEQGQHQQQKEEVEMRSQPAQQQQLLQQAETQQPGAGRQQQKQQEQRRLECNHELLHAVSAAEGCTKQQRQQKRGWCCFAGRADM